MSFKVKKDLPSLRLEIFDILSLVQNHVIPLFSSENRMISDSYFIAGNANMKGIEFGPSLSFLFSFLS